MTPLDSLVFCRRLGWAQAQPCAVWGAEGPDTLGWSEKKMEGRFRKLLEEYSALDTDESALFTEVNSHSQHRLGYPF